MDDYEEDDRFAVQMTEDFCEGRLCTATAVYGEMPECSPLIVISGKSIEKLTFDEVLSCFELKMPSGFPLCKENISKIKVSFWEKELDYCLTK